MLWCKTYSGNVVAINFLCTSSTSTTQTCARRRLELVATNGSLCVMKQAADKHRVLQPSCSKF